MKTRVQKLVADGRTEEAIEVLIGVGLSDATLLRARWSNAKKQYNMGLIDFGEWNRVQNQVNYATLEMAPSDTLVLVNQTTFVYVNFLSGRQPGNELGVCNQIFDALEKMERNREWPLADLVETARTLNDIFGMPDLLTAAEEFNSHIYQNNTTDYQQRKRETWAGALLSMKTTVLKAARQIVEKKETETAWQEAWALFLREPTVNRWKATFPLIDKRLTSPIFSPDLAFQWGELVAVANGVEEGFLWRFNFTNEVLPDLKRFVTENLR